MSITYNQVLKYQSHVIKIENHSNTHLILKSCNGKTNLNLNALKVNQNQTNS